MYRHNDEIYWADTKEELWERFNLVKPEERDAPKSVTFIASKLEDNRILMEKDPGYLANLNAMGMVDRERLLHGNWKIKPAAGLYFKRSRVNMLDAIPDDVIKWVRAWDMAATEDKKNSRPEDGPAYTAGVLIGKRRNGRYIIADVFNKRLNAADVRETIKATAIVDKVKYKHVRIRLNQDPGQAGKDQAEQYAKYLAGFSFNIERESGSKETRADPFSAQWQGLPGSEKGNVDVLIGEWNEVYFSQLESFPDS
jgi:predicted phage terminase large subunit-like protein